MQTGSDPTKTTMTFQSHHLIPSGAMAEMKKGELCLHLILQWGRKPTTRQTELELT